MSDVDLKIFSILTHIKENPGCNTNELDGHLVDDLFKQELLSGHNVSTLSSTSPEFIELRLTIDGERELEALARPRHSNIWLNKTARWIAGVLAVVLAAAIIHHLGLT